MTNIFIYFAEESTQIAGDFVTDIHKKLEWIAQVDFTGSPRDHVSKGLRAFPYRKRCIYYRTYDDKIVILRIMHGAQDVTLQELDVEHPNTSNER